MNTISKEDLTIQVLPDSNLEIPFGNWQSELPLIYTVRNSICYELAQQDIKPYLTSFITEQFVRKNHEALDLVLGVKLEQTKAVKTVINHIETRNNLQLLETVATRANVPCKLFTIPPSKNQYEVTVFMCQTPNYNRLNNRKSGDITKFDQATSFELFKAWYKNEVYQVRILNKINNGLYAVYHGFFGQNLNRNGINTYIDLTIQNLNMSNPTLHTIKALDGAEISFFNPLHYYKETQLKMMQCHSLIRMNLETVNLEQTKETLKELEYVYKQVIPLVANQHPANYKYVLSFTEFDAYIENQVVLFVNDKQHNGSLAYLLEGVTTDESLHVFKAAMPKETPFLKSIK